MAKSKSNQPTSVAQLRSLDGYNQTLRRLNQFPSSTDPSNLTSVHDLACQLLQQAFHDQQTGEAVTLAVQDYYAGHPRASADQRMDWSEFSARYCSRQDNTPSGLKLALTGQKERLNPNGWMLLECQMLAAARQAELTILPYGGGSTWKVVPSGPISPRGLASDMSVVIGVLTADKLP